MLKKLEEELGVELFDRSPNRIHLNKAGEVALVHVHAILRNVEQLKADVLSAARQIQTLSIAFCDQGVRWFSAPRFSVAHPEVRVNDDLYEGNDAVELLHERVYDLMVTPQKIQDARIQSLPFLPDQVYLSVPEDSNLAGRDSIPCGRTRPCVALSPDRRVLYDADRKGHHRKPSASHAGEEQLQCHPAPDPHHQFPRHHFHPVYRSAKRWHPTARLFP